MLEVLLAGVIGLLVVCWALLRLRYSMTRPVHVFTRRLDRYPFKSGDLIITSGSLQRGAVFDASILIKTSTESHYNHTGIVYVEPYTGQVFVWEINGTGTRMAYLHDLQHGNPPHVLAVRSLNKPIDVRLLEELIRRQQKTDFNWDMGLVWYNRFASLVPFLKGHQWTRQRTCGQLTTDTYVALGVLDFSEGRADPSSVFPSDYARDKIDRHQLPLANGYEFGPVVRLRFAPNPTNTYRPIYSTI